MKNFFQVSLLGALLLVSAPFARCAETNAVHNFARWENEIAAFERHDATNPPAKGTYVFIGSSTVRLWKTLAQDLPGRSVVNRGFGGSEIADSTHFAPRVIFPYAPKVVVLRAGGNDLFAGKSVEQVFADYQEFIAVVHAKLPDAKIVFLSLSPSIARWSQHEKEKAVNALVEKFVAGKPFLQYLETYDVPLRADGTPNVDLFIGDKLHFNASGYKLFAERVRSLLK